MILIQIKLYLIFIFSCLFSFSYLSYSSCLSFLFSSISFLSFLRSLLLRQRLGSSRLLYFLYFLTVRAYVFRILHKYYALFSLIFSFISVIGDIFRIFFASFPYFFCLFSYRRLEFLYFFIGIF